MNGLGCAPFAHHYLGYRGCFLFHRVLRCFSSPGSLYPPYVFGTGLTGHDPSRVSPFGDPRIDGWLTPPLGLSQSPTSFIGSRCQGIHRVPLSTCRRDARARYGVLKDRRTRTVRGLPARRPVVPHVEIVRPRGVQRSLRAAQGAHVCVAGPAAWSFRRPTQDVVDGSPGGGPYGPTLMSSQWFTDSHVLG